MKIDENLLLEHLKSLYGKQVRISGLSEMGTGTHGTAHRVDAHVKGRKTSMVLKRLHGNGLGHDYPADRAQVFMLSMDTFNRFPRHVNAIDVIGIEDDGGWVSLGRTRDFLFLMEAAMGTPYFDDLETMRRGEGLSGKDEWRVERLASFLATIHAKRPSFPPQKATQIYRRKIRDTIGHGECLMGVMDTYVDPTFITRRQMSDIAKRCIDHWLRIRDMDRLCRIHGDFHPGNIFFENRKLTLLDRSRGEFGEAADDITALAINYVWYSLMHNGRFSGPYREALERFLEVYLEKTGDEDLLSVVQPFFAFRGVVVANPAFYPDVPDEVRRKLIRFVLGVLKTSRFRTARINEYTRG
ncbi:MAG: phosphotransferase [Thermoplasmata archaeon]